MGFTSDTAVLARRPGRCGICDQAIVPDVDVIVCVDDEWCHDECVEPEAGEA